MRTGIRYEAVAPTTAEYNSFRSDAGWPEMDPKRVGPALKKSEYVVCAFDGEVVVGTGRVVGDGCLCFYIQDVIVLKSHHGKGIGSGLMDLIMEFISSRAINNTYVGLMSAAGKEGFYHRFGFTSRPTDELGCGMTRFWKRAT